MTIVADREKVYLGLAVHKNTISVGVLEPDEEVPRTDKISSDPDAVSHLIARFDDPSRLAGLLRGGPDEIRAGAPTAQPGGGVWR